jgi:hypothetical protein
MVVPCPDGLTHVFRAAPGFVLSNAIKDLLEGRKIYAHINCYDSLDRVPLCDLVPGNDPTQVTCMVCVITLVNGKY